MSIAETPHNAKDALLAGRAPVLPLAGGKRYHTFSHYLRATFGEKVWRISLDAGFNCPNRDGTAGRGGCTFCDADGSGAPIIKTTQDIRRQMEDGMARARQRHGVNKFIAYFQAFTNTYAPVDVLKPLYDEALACSDDIVALAIGTRPDCVPDDVLELVESYTSTHTVWIEYGLQTVNEQTLTNINRGHGVREFVEAVERTLGRGIHQCAHAIFGLPGETREDARRTTELLARLPLDGIKIHSFFVVEGAPIVWDFRQGLLNLWSREDYVTTVCDALEMLPAHMVVQRITGEAPHDLHIAPDWTADKIGVVRAIDEEMERRGTVQGERATE